MTDTSRTALPVWRSLVSHCAEVRQSHLRDVSARDPKRFDTFSIEAAGLLLDYSRQRVTRETISLLLDLAREVKLEERIAALFKGELVNNTERRAALHTALRAPADAAPLKLGAEDIRAAVNTEREKLENFVRAVHAGEITGTSGQRFDTIVNIGIGGSDLGPLMVYEALAAYRQPGIRAHFVSNIDGCQLADVLAQANPQTTLFVVCSKTFTTLETMTNAQAARKWIVSKLGSSAPAKHFAAVSTNREAMDAFGVGAKMRFTMWDWVGGRYSIWSSIGLSVALAVGVENFRAFLAGGHAMDEHFAGALFEKNLPVLMGLLAVWNRSFLDMHSLAVLPYDQRLHRFPAYLQQLEMESNGKRVTRNGQAVDYATGAVLWGEPGSNAQHSFFQLLHQGTARVALDFLAPVQSSCGMQDQQNLALANCFAQAEAFMAGLTGPQVRAELDAAGATEEQVQALAPHKVHLGNRPGTIVLFPRLDPGTLGRLIALYEHKVYVQSVVWDINPFDQWGVELGKKLAVELAPAVEKPEKAGASHPAMAGLLKVVSRWRHGG
jgi:glucose-6-phosphate isomerase